MLDYLIKIKKYPRHDTKYRYCPIDAGAKLFQFKNRYRVLEILFVFLYWYWLL